jgi:hypothetical protein
MEDANLVTQFLKHRGMEAYNSRVFKTVEDGIPTYEVHLLQEHGTPCCFSRVATQAGRSSGEKRETLNGYGTLSLGYACSCTALILGNALLRVATGYLFLPLLA